MWLAIAIVFLVVLFLAAVTSQNLDIWLYLRTILWDFPSAIARMLAASLLVIPFFLVHFYFEFSSIQDFQQGCINCGSWTFGDMFSDALGSTFPFWFFVTVLLGFYPILVSLVTLAMPFFSVGTDALRIIGARNASIVTGERAQIDDTMKRIEQQAKRFKVEFVQPEMIQVIDSPYVDSYTIGRIIYINRGMFITEYLGAALAHELGHLTNRDGRLLLALRRLLIPLAFWFGIDRSPKAAGVVSGSGAVQSINMGDDAALYYKMKTVGLKLQLAFWMGGLGLMFKAQEWAQEWKRRDFKADEFAVRLGYKIALQQFLTDYQELDIAQPYLLSGRPYTAERLDQLQELPEPQEIQLSAPQAVSTLVAQQSERRTYRNTQEEFEEVKSQLSEIFNRNQIQGSDQAALKGDDLKNYRALQERLESLKQRMNQPATASLLASTPASTPVSTPVAQQPDPSTAED